MAIITCLRYGQPIAHSMCYTYLRKCNPMTSVRVEPSNRRALGRKVRLRCPNPGRQVVTRWRQPEIGAARHAAYAAGQAGVVAHVAAHELGAAAYAIKAAREAALDGQAEEAGRLECAWQRAQLPSEIRDLVLDDQKLRNEICWFVFDC
jgi:hypothetical protein